MLGISPGQRPPASDLSSAGAEQRVVARSSDRDQFFPHTSGKIIGGSSESLFQARHQSQNVRVKYLALQMEFFEPGRRCLCHYYIVKTINSALLPTLRYIAAHNGSPKLHYHASDQNCPAPGNHLLNLHNLTSHRGLLQVSVTQTEGQSYAKNDIKPH